MAESFICANDLRKGHFILVDSKLAKVKEISRSKTGKHGSCKLSIKCTDVFKEKTLMHMCNSQDQVGVVEPETTVWKVKEVHAKEGLAELVRGSEQCTVKADKDTLLLLQDEGEALDCSVLTWEGKFTLLRVAKEKKEKRR